MKFDKVSCMSMTFSFPFVWYINVWSTIVTCTSTVKKYCSSRIRLYFLFIQLGLFSWLSSYSFISLKHAYCIRFRNGVFSFLSIQSRVFMQTSFYNCALHRLDSRHTMPMVLVSKFDLPGMPYNSEKPIQETTMIIIIYLSFICAQSIKYS